MLQTMTKHLLFKFIDRAIDWLFRPRTLALGLLKYGAILIGAVLSLDYIAQIVFRNESATWSFRFATGEGFPKWAALVTFGLGCTLVVLGILIAGYRAWLDIKREARARLIVVEMRGLHTSPDTPAKDADFGEQRDFREWLLVDLRHGMNNHIIIDPEAAVEKVGLLPTHIEMKAQGRDKRDIKVAVGGLAPVPLLFLTGVLLDDESSTLLYDWDRDAKVWKTISGPDDGKRFIPAKIEMLPVGLSEVVLAVSVSYTADSESLLRTFSPNVPVVELVLEQVVPNRHWSEDKQRALTAQLRDTLAALAGKGVNRVHLVLASPASLTIRMGMAYDRRLMPEIVVYQYERSLTPPYPWGVRMPSHGIPTAAVVLPPSPKQ